MQHYDMWNGVFSHIKHAMQIRQATHAVLYLLTRDKRPHLLPVHADDTAVAACGLSRTDNIRYIGFVLMTNQGGTRQSEFHPIYPCIDWPSEIVQDIVHRAYQVAG